MSAVTHGRLPWSWEEMATSIVVKDADGRTVCNLPRITDPQKRRANAEMIVESANARASQTGAVVNLPVVTTLRADPRGPLRQATDAELSSVVIVGYKEDGGFFFASSLPDAAEVIFLCELAKLKLLKIVDGT